MEMVFISGWGQSASQGESLLELFDSGQLVAPDQLESWSAEGLSSLLKEQDASVIIGWSAGGMLAIDYALSYPKRVKALILISSSSRFTSSGDYSFEGESLGVPFSELRFLRRSLSENKELALSNFQKNVGTKDSKAEKYIHGVSEHNLELGLDFLEKFDRRADLGQIACPSLILCGLKDRIIGPKDSMYLSSRISGSSLKIFPNASHSLFGGELLEEVKNFVANEIN